MLNTLITSQSGKEITFKNPYAIVCNGVKKTANAKKTIAHRLEAQFNQLSTAIDKKSNGFVSRMKRK